MPDTKRPAIRRPHFPDKILLVPISVRDERLAICNACPNNVNLECNIHRKPIYAMIVKKAIMCPLGFWSSYYGS
jgi:hypothetical protein